MQKRSVRNSSQKKEVILLIGVDTQSQPASVRMFGKAVRRSENMRKGFLANRDLALRNIHEKQKEIAMKVAEVQRTVQKARESLKDRTVNIGFRGSVNQRVDRGLIGLEKMVQDLRDALLGLSPSELTNLGPEIYREIEDETSRITKSEFFRAIKKQLETEKEGSA
jgi:hypothetical protein